MKPCCSEGVIAMSTSSIIIFSTRVLHFVLVLRRVIGLCLPTLLFSVSLGTLLIIPVIHCSPQSPVSSNCSIFSIFLGTNISGYRWYTCAGIPSMPGAELGSILSSAFLTMSSVGSFHRCLVRFFHLVGSHTFQRTGCTVLLSCQSLSLSLSSDSPRFQIPCV